MSSSKNVVMKKSLAEIVNQLYPSPLDVEDDAIADGQQQQQGDSGIVVNGQEQQQYHGYDIADVEVDDEKEDGQYDDSEMEEEQEDVSDHAIAATTADGASSMPAVKTEVQETTSSASPSMSPPHASTYPPSYPLMLPSTSAAAGIASLDPRTLDPATLSFITSIITAAATANSISINQLLSTAPLHLQPTTATTPSTTNNNYALFAAQQALTTSSLADSFDLAAAAAAAAQQQNLFSSFASSSSTPSSSIPATSSSSNSTFLLPYIVPKSSLTTTSKKRINRGRAFKAHKGIYNIVVDGVVLSADYLIDALRTELTKKQSELPPIIVEGVNVCEKLSLTIDLLPHLNNPSHCGAVVAGHLFPRDFFVDHILRDVEGNVKAAKGFINHSNREPLSCQASKLFFDILYYYGGVIIEPDMLESWMWVARKGVNDRGNTSKSGRGVRYFVKADYQSILQSDLWAQEKSS